MRDKLNLVYIAKVQDRYSSKDNIIKKVDEAIVCVHSERSLSQWNSKTV
jgi:hypothetical protein